MNRLEAIDRAVEIGGLIMSGTNRLRLTAVKNLPLLAMLPLMKLSADAKKGKEMDIESINPRVFEILIFGSCANGHKEVGDIDIMILDNGFFSNFFSREDRDEDWYGKLADNLHLLLTGWLNYPEAKIADTLSGVSTDLHVLPLKMLKSVDLRAEIAKKHDDPHFFQNAFSAMLRFDGETFIPIDIAYLEKKYKTDLSNLRN